MNLNKNVIQVSKDLIKLDFFNIFLTINVVLILKKNFLHDMSLLFSLLLGFLLYKAFETLYLSFLFYLSKNKDKSNAN